jgi:hypothetical protein
VAEPIQFQTVEVVLEGLSQKDDKKATTPGKLRHAVNVEFDKTHALNKTRGYEHVKTTAHTLASEWPPLFLTAATYRQELVLYDYARLYAVLSIPDVVSDAAIVRRGPTMRGNYRVHTIFTSSISEPGAPEDEVIE